jgi:hypothetical protein
MANTTYTCLLARWPLPTIMRRVMSPQGCQFKPMDVACSQDLVEIWIEMLAPQMASAAYTSLLLPRALPTNMRQRTTPQGRQFKPMYVQCSS